MDRVPNVSPWENNRRTHFLEMNHDLIGYNLGFDPEAFGELICRKRQLYCSYVNNTGAGIAPQFLNYRQVFSIVATFAQRVPHHVEITCQLNAVPSGNRRIGIVIGFGF
jgi:hypothetical protein